MDPALFFSTIIDSHPFTAGALAFSVLAISLNALIQTADKVWFHGQRIKEKRAHHEEKKETVKVECPVAQSEITVLKDDHRRIETSLAEIKGSLS